MWQEPEAWAAHDDATRRRHRRLSERPDRRRRAGGAALRLVGGRALAGRLSRPTCCRTRATVMQALRPGVPVIHFGVGTGGLLPLMREAGGDVIGLDWRVELGPTWARLGHDVAVQGNLDPAVLLANVDAIRRRGARDPRRGGGSPGTHLQPRARHPQGDAGRARAGARRHRPRAVRAMSAVRLGAARRLRRAGAARGHPPVPPDRHARARDPARAPRGGRAPLRDRSAAARRSNELTRRQADALRRGARGRDRALPVWVGMRNWHPFLHETLAEMQDRGQRRALGIILSSLPDRGLVGPLRGRRGRRAGEGRPRRARGRLRAAVGRSPALRGRDGGPHAARRWRRSSRRAGPPRASCSPRTACRWPWPRARRMRRSSRRRRGAIAGPARPRALVTIAYQSRSGSPRDPWLEPDVADAIRALGREGARDVVVVPVGFVCDHVEVLYDLDVEARASGGGRRGGLPSRARRQRPSRRSSPCWPTWSMRATER